MMVNIISIATMNPLQGGDEWRSTWAKRVAIALGRSRSWLSHPDEDPGVEEGRICGSKTLISEQKMKGFNIQHILWVEEGRRSSLTLGPFTVNSILGWNRKTDSL